MCVCVCVCVCVCACVCVRVRARARVCLVEAGEGGGLHPAVDGQPVSDIEIGVEGTILVHREPRKFMV